MKSYKFNISIQSSPQHVFHVLTDYPNYARWNRWFVVPEGEARKGGKLVLRARSFWAFLPFRFEFDRVEPGALLQRRQIGWMRHFLRMERERVLYTKTDGSTLYKTRLVMSGPLEPFVTFFFSSFIRGRLKEESLGLKEYCETHYGISSVKQAVEVKLRRFDPPADLALAPA